MFLEKLSSLEADVDSIRSKHSCYSLGLNVLKNPYLKAHSSGRKYLKVINTLRGGAL
jgi:hypothetical protein